MPAINPVKGRNVWKVYCETTQKGVWHVGPAGLVALFGGKMFVSKAAAEKFAMSAALKYPEFFGQIAVAEYTCNGREGVDRGTIFLNPPRRRKYARPRRRARR